MAGSPIDSQPKGGRFDGIKAGNRESEKQKSGEVILFGCRRSAVDGH